MISSSLRTFSISLNLRMSANRMVTSDFSLMVAGWFTSSSLLISSLTTCGEWNCSSMICSRTRWAFSFRKRALRMAAEMLLANTVISFSSVSWNVLSLSMRFTFSAPMLFPPIFSGTHMAELIRLFVLRVPGKSLGSASPSSNRGSPVSTTLPAIPLPNATRPSLATSDPLPQAAAVLTIFDS